MDLNYDMACRIIGDLYLQTILKDNQIKALLQEVATLKAQNESLSS